jgi:ABC-type sugar transport system permease subunit
MMIFPLGYTLWNSFSGWSLTAGQARTPSSAQQNYIELLTGRALLERRAGTRFYFTAVAMALELTLGVAIALLLDAKDYPGKRVVTSHAAAADDGDAGGGGDGLAADVRADRRA